jgi:RimJ/RimL family protein N-acetyltransferase
MNTPGPAYRIHTARLVLRCWEPNDAPLLSTAIAQSLEHLLPWMPWAINEPIDLDQRVQVLRSFRGNFDLNKDFVYGVFNSDETRVLGGTGLHTRPGERGREIGYWIHKDFTRQGFATELSAALTRIAFEIEHISRVEIHCDPRNAHSAAIPRKLGYTHEATLHNRMQDNEGHLRDSMIWTLFLEDYPNTLSASAQVEAYDVLGQRIL